MLCSCNDDILYNLKIIIFCFDAFLNFCSFRRNVILVFFSFHKINSRRTKKYNALTRQHTTSFSSSTTTQKGTVSTEAALTRQLNLLQEHACRIRPVELGRLFGRLEFFTAPGDTELLTSQNDPGIVLKKVEIARDDGEEVRNVKLLEVGLNLEVVTNRGVGFFVVRTEDGVVPPHLLE